MTRNKLNKILLQAELYYRVFPVEKETINHKVINQVVPIIKRIMEYRGATKGSNALPKNLLEMRYNEIYYNLQELREKVDKKEKAHREALKALNDAEELLNYIFI